MIHHQEKHVRSHVNNGQYLRKQGHVLIFVWILCFFYDLINCNYHCISQWCINLFMTTGVVVTNSFVDISVVFNLFCVCISVSVNVFAFE